MPDKSSKGNIMAKDTKIPVLFQGTYNDYISLTYTAKYKKPRDSRQALSRIGCGRAFRLTTLWHGSNSTIPILTGRIRPVKEWGGYKCFCAFTAVMD